MASTNDSLGNARSESTAAHSTKDSFWTPGRIAITLIVAALIIWYGISRWGANPATNTTTAGNPAAKTAPEIVKPAPPAAVAMPPELRDAQLNSLDGGKLKLSDFNDQVVVLNIWAVWCGPCRVEMPELIKISNEYKSRGLTVVGVATSYREDQTQVKQFIEEQKIPYKIIFDDGTLESALVQLVHADSVIPQSFLIARDGRIVGHFQGFNPYSTPQRIRQAIEDALNEKSKA